MQRREVFRKSAGLLLTAGAFGLAGCGNSDDNADEDDEDDGDGPSGDSGDDGNDNENGDANVGENADPLGSSCGTPSGPLADALPDSESYTMIAEPVEDEQGEDVVASIRANYVNESGDARFTMIILEFDSPSAAQNEADQFAGNTTQLRIGYVATGSYFYAGYGPNESAILDFMATAPALSECAESAVRFVEVETVDSGDYDIDA